MNQTRKNILDELEAHRDLTHDGREWLITALDPFHDYNHQISGYPDADVSNTVVACYQYEYNLTAPGAANWDAHIYTNPLLSSYAGTPVNTESANWDRLTEPAVASTWAQAPLVMRSVNAGLSLGPEIPAVAGNINVLPATGSQDLLSGCSRIIAMGFEVHNTTAEIYKQGAVTTYRMPQSETGMQAVWQNNAGTSWSVVQGSKLRAPPKDVAAANLLRGTRTWEAKDGVYATVFQSTVTNPLRMASQQYIVLDPNPDSGTAAAVSCSPLFAVLPVVNPTSYTPYPTQTAPFDTTGAIFTGLSKETTLTVKLRVYVERAPTWSEPELAVLASPSAAYDVNALQLYAAAVNMLPPAVKVDENAAGDWFRGVLKVIKHLAAPLGTLATPFLPGAGLVGSAISSVAGQLLSDVPVSAQIRLPAKKPKPQKKGNAKKSAS